MRASDDYCPRFVQRAHFSLDKRGTTRAESSSFGVTRLVKPDLINSPMPSIAAILVASGIDIVFLGEDAAP